MPVREKSLMLRSTIKDDLPTQTNSTPSIRRQSNSLAVLMAQISHSMAIIEKTTCRKISSWITETAIPPIMSMKETTLIVCRRESALRSNLLAAREEKPAMTSVEPYLL